MEKKNEPLNSKSASLVATIREAVSASAEGSQSGLELLISARIPGSNKQQQDEARRVCTLVSGSYLDLIYKIWEVTVNTKFKATPLIELVDASSRGFSRTIHGLSSLHHSNTRSRTLTELELYSASM